VSVAAYDRGAKLDNTNMIKPLKAREFECNGKIAPAGTSIYVVDDAPHLMELYTTLLESSGCSVRAFDDRAEALAALKIARSKPELLITDYRGASMSADQFLHQCRGIHPNLKILMASGFSRGELQLLRESPDRFIQKPFTLEEFLQEVRAALASNESGPVRDEHYRSLPEMVSSEHRAVA
jgi:CheY-like chemotaxis protein